MSFLVPVVNFYVLCFFMKMGNFPTCFVSKIGFDGSILSQIWELDGWSRLYSPLSLHQSWVTDIQFCKNNLHMVTVGDKIAWWSLEHLPNKRPRTKRNSLADPFRRRKRGDSESKSGKVISDVSVTSIGYFMSDRPR